MSKNISRDYDDWEISNHIDQMAHRRGISAHEVKGAVETGVIDQKEPEKALLPDEQRQRQIAFKLEMPIPLYVIADPKSMTLITTYYDDAEGAEEGSLLK